MNTTTEIIAGVASCEEECMQKTCPEGMQPIYMSQEYECICGVKPR